MPLEDAGLLGVDKGKGGKFLLLPPGYKDTPPAGYIPLQSDTFGGYFLFRASLKSHSAPDVAAAVAYGKQMKVYPLTRAADPAATVFTDAKDVDFDSTIRYDASFFASLNRVVQEDTLKSLGIEKGKPFQPDAATKTVLASAAQEAHAWLAAKYETPGLPPFFSPTSRWTAPALPEVVKAQQNAFSEPNEYPVDARGLGYHEPSTKDPSARRVTRAGAATA